MTTVLIKNGHIVTAIDDYRADVLIDNGRVATIGRELDVEAFEDYRDGRA